MNLEMNLSALPQTELLRRAYLASDALETNRDDRSLELYNELMNEIDRRSSSIETPLGTLKADPVEESDGYWGIQVNLVKPDGTGGLVSWTEVSEEDEGKWPSLHTLSFDGMFDAPHYVECDPEGFCMNEKMEANDSVKVDNPRAISVFEAEIVWTDGTYETVLVSEEDCSALAIDDSIFFTIPYEQAKSSIGLDIGEDFVFNRIVGSPHIEQSPPKLNPRIDHGSLEDYRVHELASRLVYLAKDLDPYGYDDTAACETPAEEADLMYDNLQDPDFARALYDGLSKMSGDDVPSDLVDSFNSVKSDLSQFIAKQKPASAAVPRNPQAYATAASKIAMASNIEAVSIEQKRTHGV